MFIVDTTISVNWTVPPMVVPILLEDFDVKVTDPNGVETVYLGAIAVEDYISPTDTTDGGVSYHLTPTIKGVWSVVLIVDDGIHDLNLAYNLQVHINDTHIYQQVRL